MASIKFKDLPRAISEAGELLPGASLWFTAEGGDSPQGVYADPGLQVPLSNPLPSDGAGRFPPFWYDSALTYRVRLLSVDGATVWDRDPVEVLPFTLPVAPLDDGGAPMPFASLTFYRAQTTALQDVFSNRPLTEPLAQPVTAAIDGEFNSIYLDDTETYRVKLERADGTLVYDVDSYQVAPDPNTEPPTAPVLTVDGDTTAELSWTASTPASGDTILDYRVFRSAGGAAFTFLVEVGPDVLEYEDSTVIGGILYEYYVIAQADYGGDSDPSNVEEFGFDGDPYFADVVLLLQVKADGLMHETSGVPHTVTVIGDGEVTNAVELFGLDTFYNPGTAVKNTNFVQAVAAAGTYFFPGDYTFEGWFSIDSFTDTFNGFFSNEIPFGAGPDFWFLYYAADYSIGLYPGALFYPGTLPAFGELYHFAVCRGPAPAGETRVFINGVKVGESTGTIQNIGATDATIFRIGAANSLDSDNGDSNFHFGEIRITKGVRRYTTNFTPPTAPFPSF